MGEPTLLERRERQKVGGRDDALPAPAVKANFEHASMLPPRPDWGVGTKVLSEGSIGTTQAADPVRPWNGRAKGPRKSMEVQRCR